MREKPHLEPLAEPSAARDKATADNATVQDLAVSLVDMLGRANKFDAESDTVHARALLGLCQKHRTLLAQLEKHTMACIRAIDGHGSTTGLRQRGPLSLKRIQLGYSHTERRTTE